MTAVDLAQAQEKLGELIERVARGETVEITRDGEAVARLTAPAEKRKQKKKPKEYKPIDFERLRALWDGMPPQSEDAGTFIRRMRDNERY
jgi:prevent-host-death family protein